MNSKRVRVAFATDDLQTVNAEFVKARHLMIFEVTPDSSVLERTLDFAGGEGGGMASPRVTALAGCAVVFVPRPISGEEALGLIRSQVFITKLQNVEAIAEVIERLQAMLRGNPPLWLRRAMTVEACGAAAAAPAS
jgi:nitrogen fixation protein NifX